METINLFEIAEAEEKVMEVKWINTEDGWNEDCKNEFIREFLYGFTNAKFKIEGKEYILVQTERGDTEKSCTYISLLYKREDGKFFVTGYTDDEHGYYDTQPDELEEVIIKRTEQVTKYFY